MKAIIIVGLGFGDEGKGAGVDALARDPEVDLVVRYSGGAQAGHNVQLPDGRRHAFAQFGAGTFAGVKTYLGPRMIISPATMIPEAEHLRSLGVKNPFDLLSAHPDCLVSTIYHVSMNRLRERARGSGKHGSCGLGIGEARHYWVRYGKDAVVASDLKNRKVLIKKLTLLRDRFLLDMQELSHIDPEQHKILYETSPAKEAEVLQRSSVELALSPEMPAFHTAIFEGAQGVLLDEYFGFHPHTTWSTVTPLHALEMIEERGVTDVEVLGVTRAYSTRHGAGPFPTYCPEMSETIVDPGNPVNGWQGSMRSGPLDLVLLSYAARACNIDGLIVSSLDQLPARVRVCTSYEKSDALETPRSLREQEKLTRLLESAHPLYTETDQKGLLDLLGEIAPVRMTAHGPTAQDRTTTDIWVEGEARLRV